MITLISVSKPLLHFIHLIACSDRSMIGEAFQTMKLSPCHSCGHFMALRFFEVLVYRAQQKVTA